MNTPLPASSLPSRKGTLAAFLLFWVVVELVIAVGLPFQLMSVPFGLAVTELVAILLPAVLYVRVTGLAPREALRLRPVSGKTMGAALILGISGLPLALAANAMAAPLASMIFGRPPATGGLSSQAADLKWVLPIAALLPGVCEELLFRGAIQGTLERLGRTKAIVIAALLFALFHVNPWNFAGPFLLGLAFGMVTVRANSVLPSMVWHTFVNATAFISYVIFQSDLPPWWLVTLSAVVFVAAGIWFFFLTGKEPHRPSPPAFSGSIEAARVRRLAQTAGVGVGLLLVGGFTCFATSSVATDLLAPEIPRGSIALAIRNRFAMIEPKPGDVITYRKAGKLFIRRATRVTQDNVWVTTKSDDGQVQEEEIRMSDVTGKVIKHFDVPHTHNNQ